MAGRIGTGLQQSIAGHSTPGGNISSSGGVIGGHQQCLSWLESAHGQHEFHDELPTALLAQIKRLIGIRWKTLHHSGLSQKITVTLFAFLLCKQFVPRHATPGWKILANSRIGGSHFEYGPRREAFHCLQHEHQETTATSLVTAIAYCADSNFLSIPSAKNII
jgi:hypothetical protein